MFSTHTLSELVPRLLVVCSLYLYNTTNKRSSNILARTSLQFVTYIYYRHAHANVSRYFSGFVTKLNMGGLRVI